MCEEWYGYWTSQESQESLGEQALGGCGAGCSARSHWLFEGANCDQDKLQRFTCWTGYVTDKRVCSENTETLTERLADAGLIDWRCHLDPLRFRAAQATQSSRRIVCVEAYNGREEGSGCS